MAIFNSDSMLVYQRVHQNSWLMDVFIAFHSPNISKHGKNIGFCPPHLLIFKWEAHLALISIFWPWRPRCSCWTQPNNPQRTSSGLDWWLSTCYPLTGRKLFFLEHQHL